MLKKKNLLNKKIVFNKVASKFRNYISEPLITFSKTAISASFLDSYLTKNNNNTTINNNFFINNSQVNIDNKNHDSFDKIKKKLSPYNKQNDLKEFNIKFNDSSNKNKKRIITNYQNKSKSKYNLNLFFYNAINDNKLKKSSSYARYKTNIINKNPFRNSYNKIILRSKSKLDIYNYGNKNEILKLELNSMINELKKESNEVDEFNNKFNNYLNKGKIYKNSYNENQNKMYNILNSKERDLKKFKDFAISKLMDLNDIKNQNEGSFFDYNYNRNYINRRKKDFENNYKLIKIIPRNIKYYQSRIKNNKIDEIIKNL